MVALARANKLSEVFVPADDANEASLLDNIKIMPCISLAQLISHLRGDICIPEHKPETSNSSLDFSRVDLMHIKGQEHAKRALEISAAGAHNIIMSGPPGIGKTMLARSLPSILPTMTLEEALEVTKI